MTRRRSTKPMNAPPLRDGEDAPVFLSPCGDSPGERDAELRPAIRHRHGVA